MKLRPYQQACDEAISSAWLAGAVNVLAVEPTGGGKTVIFSEIVKRNAGTACVIAHRQELVIQISLALARDGVQHRIIGPKDIIALAVATHLRELGKSYYSPGSRTAVAGVDTLIRRTKQLMDWAQGVTLWVLDEAHHLLAGNKWGTAARMFPNARGLGVTATAGRTDGRGLGRHSDGLFDVMVVGNSPRELINMGYLTDYRLYGVESEFNRDNIETSGSTGELKRASVKKELRRAPIVGNIVDHYLRIAPGKIGVTFSANVEEAQETAAEFNRKGVPAAVVTADTPAKERAELVQKLGRRDLLQLINVDIFGEGFDLPAIEVVSLGRPTESFALLCQQVGRALRIKVGGAMSAAWGDYTDAQRLQFIAESAKPHAIIIDHVGNIKRHAPRSGLPDRPSPWSLDRRDKRGTSSPSDAIPVTTCLNPECLAIYERIYSACPYCGHKPVAGVRSSPEKADGDLVELDPGTLLALQSCISRVDMSPAEFQADMAARNVPGVGQGVQLRAHTRGQEAQAALRASMAWWAGYQQQAGRVGSERDRRFYFAFGVDKLAAQALGAKEALALAARINKHLVEAVV